VPFRPLTVVAVMPEEAAALGVSKRALAARANARVPLVAYWLSVAALTGSAAFCIWAFATDRVVRVVDTPIPALTSVVRVFASLALLAGPPLTLMAITRINQRHVFAARRDLGEPICGRCGYPLAADGPRVCPECGESHARN